MEHGMERNTECTCNVIRNRIEGNMKQISLLMSDFGVKVMTLSKEISVCLRNWLSMDLSADIFIRRSDRRCIFYHLPQL